MKGRKKGVANLFLELRVFLRQGLELLALELRVLPHLGQLLLGISLGLETPLDLLVLDWTNPESLEGGQDPWVHKQGGRTKGSQGRHLVLQRDLIALLLHVPP